jgi:Alginate lyase
MINKNWLMILFLSFAVNVISAQEVAIINTDKIKLDFSVLAEKKKSVQLKDASLMPAYNELKKNADKLLKYEPVSVMDKKDLPPSGDKHDYMSLAPYWWPDPSKPNGLPYIRKDGETNPEVKNYTDKVNMPRLCENVYLLSLAYYYSGDEKYATHASKLLQVWFLDSDTKMNPNLKYGQAIKGVTEGRGAGIIDTRHFVFVIDALELLKKSKSWTGKSQLGMQKWFSDFLHWLDTSKIGIDEKNAKNNHGVWYDAQTLSMALFIDSIDLAKKIIARSVNRLDIQMDANGFFPLEMERTTSLHYTVFVLDAFCIIAQLSEKTGMNFWTLETKSGKSLSKALQAIFPYISKEKQWFGPQIKPFNFAEGFQLFIRGAAKLKCSGCADAVKKIAGSEYEKLLVNLL